MKVEVRQLTMEELSLIKGATGRDLIEALKPPPLDERMTAAVVWVVRRRTAPKLSFETVYSTLTVDEQSALVLDLGD